MKYVRITGSPDPTRSPALFDVLARSSYVEETRLYDWNLASGDGVTLLFEVDGDVDPLRAAVADAPGVLSADATPVVDGQFTLLCVIDPDAVPLLEDILGVITREGLVVAKPVVYRDGEVHARIVGSASVLQAAVDGFPASVAVEITAVGDFDRGRQSPTSSLSDRQRAALRTAFDLGYYECPRRATHEDVAAELGCAPNTVTEHLQKAERTVIGSVLEETAR